MIYDSHEVEEGQTVYLTPHTKGASRACHEQRTVTIMQPPARFWPYIVVEWKEDNDLRWERVHKDNIKKKPTTTATVAQRKEGDMGGTTEGKWQRKTALPKPVALIENQMELF